MAANPELKEKVEEVLRECGFSMRVVGMLEQMGTEYGAIDVLPILDPLREVTGEISDWRTFPQLYVDGQLVGGADIVEEMFESGELAETLGVEQPKAAAAPAQPEAPANQQQSPPLQVDGA
jgi:monothiol glutaredoxin